MGGDDVAVAELLAALSVATDLGMGQEPEMAVRACLVATRLARAAGLPGRDVADVYYCTLLQHLGCTAASHETAVVFGDDLASAPRAERTDDRRLREVLGLLAAAGSGSATARLRHLTRALTTGRDAGEQIRRSVCEVGAQLAERLHLGAGVCAGLHHALESWDGRHGALGLSGEDIALPARFAVVARQAVIFDGLGGPAAALAMVRRRAGGWFDPSVAAVFVRVGVDALRATAAADVWAEVAAAEPEPRRRVPATHLDDVAAAFADMVDLKTPFTLGHSAGVAALAAGAAEALGLPAGEVALLRRAGLLHDLGRVAVSNAVWERPGPLRTAEWERVRLHAYHSERILGRAALLAPVARVAGRHHERLDGSGYHRGATGGELGAEARLLAAADVFQALTQERPQRPALAPPRAAEALAAAAAAGTLDPDSVRAVVEAAGQRPPRTRSAWPAGLTDREVEVLRLVARGLSNRQVAAELVVSPRTAEHHVQHIYAKIGVSTRAGAALFAMEHGLVR